MPTIDLAIASLWTKGNIFWGVLTFSWIVFWWELYLQLRQLNVYKTAKKIPTELESVLDEKSFNKARDYGIDKANFSLFSSFWSQFQSTITLYFFLMPYFWDLSRKFMISYLGFANNQSNEIYQSLIFLLITTVLSTFIDMPQSIYYTFVIEQRHGFNNQTIGFFLWDKAKKFLVSYSIMAPITATVIYIVRSSGPYFFLYLWIFAFVVMCLLVFFQGEIAALFDTFTPLPAGELKDRIEALADSVGFPLTGIFIVEGSKRSSHSNAYFTGMFNKKRIVIYDTLIEDYDKRFKQNSTSTSDNTETKEDNPIKEDEDGKQKKGCSDDEIIAILCHEIGHWHYNHLFKNLCIAEISLFLQFLLFSKCYVNDTLFEAFGFYGEKPVIIGLTLMMMLLAPYSEVLGFMTTRMSRTFEYQADYYAKLKGYAEFLKSGLVKLNINNLGFPIYDELYSEFNHSHPTIIQRIAALSKTD